MIWSWIALEFMLVLAMQNSGTRPYNLQVDSHQSNANGLIISIRSEFDPEGNCSQKEREERNKSKFNFFKKKSGNELERPLWTVGPESAPRKSKEREN